MKLYLIQPGFEDEIPVRSITLDFKIDDQKRTCHINETILLHQIVPDWLLLDFTTLNFL